MLRTLLIASALFTAPTALACGGSEGCSHCDKAASTAKDSAIDQAIGEHATLSIAGMKCGKCAEKVRTALLEVEGVHAASVELEEARVTVAYDEGTTNVDTLIAAIGTNTHFTASLPGATPTPESN